MRLVYYPQVGDYVEFRPSAYSRLAAITATRLTSIGPLVDIQIATGADSVTKYEDVPFLNNDGEAEEGQAYCVPTLAKQQHLINLRSVGTASRSPDNVAWPDDAAEKNLVADLRAEKGRAEAREENQRLSASVGRLASMDEQNRMQTQASELAEQAQKTATIKAGDLVNLIGDSLRTPLLVGAVYSTEVTVYWAQHASNGQLIKLESATLPTQTLIPVPQAQQ